MAEAISALRATTRRNFARQRRHEADGYLGPSASGRSWNVPRPGRSLSQRSCELVTARSQPLPPLRNLLGLCAGTAVSGSTCKPEYDMRISTRTPTGEHQHSRMPGFPSGEPIDARCRGHRQGTLQNPQRRHPCRNRRQDADHRQPGDQPCHQRCPQTWVVGRGIQAADDPDHFRHDQGAREWLAGRTPH